MTSVTQDGRVEFRFFRPNVSAVAVAGSFNGWNPDALPMEDAGDGWWAGSVELEPGVYEFRYVADGQWYTDFAAHGVELATDGWNSLIVLPES